MSTDEEKRQWEESVIGTLKPERDKLQAQLDKIRELRMNLGLANRDKRREYLMKIGELSLLFGAAITPIIIVADSKAQFQEFAVVGVGLYLTNGILALWRCKTILYQDAKDTPQVGLDEEMMLMPVIHAHNKLLHDPSSKTYQSEYTSVSKASLDQGQEIQGQQHRIALDFWADMVLYGFVLATLFVARTIWPFGNDWYLVAILGFVSLVCTLLIVGYRRAQKSRAALERKRILLLVEMTEYQKWHNREILKQ